MFLEKAVLYNQGPALKGAVTFRKLIKNKYTFQSKTPSHLYFIKHLKNIIVIPLFST